MFLPGEFQGRMNQNAVLPEGIGDRTLQDLGRADLLLGRGL